MKPTTSCECLQKFNYSCKRAKYWVTNLHRFPLILACHAQLKFAKSKKGSNSGSSVVIGGNRIANLTKSCFCKSGFRQKIFKKICFFDPCICKGGPPSPPWANFEKKIFFKNIKIHSVVKFSEVFEQKNVFLAVPYPRRARLSYQFWT